MHQKHNSVGKKPFDIIYDKLTNQLTLKRTSTKKASLKNVTSPNKQRIFGETNSITMESMVTDHVADFTPILVGYDDKTLKSHF